MKPSHVYRNLKQREVDFFCTQCSDGWAHGYWILRRNWRILGPRIDKFRLNDMTDWRDLGEISLDSYPKEVRAV